VEVNAAKWKLLFQFTIKDKIKNFFTRIYTEPPDIQNMLLKQFVESVNYTLSTHIKIKSNLSENILLEKILYTSF
jgi:hypothetical protein